MKCVHFQKINLPLFLQQNRWTIGWICLNDGCLKIKKNINHKQLSVATKKLPPSHNIMINCDTFEIYCTACETQIYDVEDEEQEHKHFYKISPLSCRELLLIKSQSEDIVFAGNSEYPPSFQKEKKGLCGLKVQSITSYLNSILQLLANVHSFKEICLNTNLEQISIKPLKILMKIICKIWEGKYRILKVEELKEQMVFNGRMKSYLNKSPQFVLYEVMRWMGQQFSYAELRCKAGEIVSEPYDEWKTQNCKNYSPLKEMFGGECIFEQVCQNCNHTKLFSNKFQCLKLSIEKYGFYHEKDHHIEIIKLIEEAFNWKNSEDTYFKKCLEGKSLCENCSKTISIFYTYVAMPNYLLMEFGQYNQGLNVKLPQQLNLLQFTEERVKDKKILDQSQATYEYLGSISCQNKRFVTHAKNPQTNKSYIFRDELICEGEKNQINVKIALYKIKSNQKYFSLARNIHCSLQAKINPVVPIPDFWNIYLAYHYHTQPLMNPFICSHGKVKGNLHLSKSLHGVKRIPIQIYQYLIETFGGRNISIKGLDQKCEECLQKINSITQIKNSERQMALFADKLSNKKRKMMISKDWLEKWKKFVYEDDQSHYKYFGNPRPGTINNHQGINQNKTLRQQFFKKISGEVWYFLKKFYGGGPQINKSHCETNLAVISAVNLRYESISQLVESFKSKNGEQNRVQNLEQIIQEEEEQSIYIQKEDSSKEEQFDYE